MKMEGRGSKHPAKPMGGHSMGAGRAETARPNGPRPAAPKQHGPRSTSSMTPPTDPFGRPLAAPDHFATPGSQSRPFVPQTQTVNVNVNNKKGGLIGALIGGATTVAVGAISGKLENERQEKIIEQQGKQQALIEQQRAQNEMLLRQQENEAMLQLNKQENETKIELKKLDVEEAEIERDIIQDKRYYANCPYCLGINKNNEKECPFCGKSLAYYNGDPNNAPTAYNS